MFRSRQAEAEKLPPTRSALEQSILRAHLQSIIWTRSDEVKPRIPSPFEYGWVEGETTVCPVMSLLDPAPQAILELVKCNCSSSHCSSKRCKCRAQNLTCSELCGCYDFECENTTPLNAEEGESDSEYS